MPKGNDKETGMRPEVMKAEYSQFRERILQLLLDLHELTRETGDQELSEIASGLLKNVNAPFLFVVVGEVKSGKSSFINALLGEELCAVAPDPCTDLIQKIVYSEEPFERSVSEMVREVGRPSEVLREIAIVDTPGTNSIIERHQELTERFIPESDLVLFVFSAVNPYSRTAWDLFRLVHQQWGKKIVFILQQADRASSEELETNFSRVEELARSLGVDQPRVFAVSARKAREGSGGGMEKVWSFIQETVTGGRHYLLKMESLLSTASQVLGRVGEDVRRLEEGLDKDRSEAAKIEAALSRGRESSLREIDVLKARLLQGYIRVSEETMDEFEAGLSVPSLVRSSFRSVFSKRNLFREWLEELIRRFNEKLSRKADEAGRESSEIIAEHIVRTTGDLLSDLRESGKDRPWVNISSMARRRFKVVDEVMLRLARLMHSEELSDRLRPQGLRKIGDQALLGGFITLVGAVIAGTTHAIIFDVTGGIVTTIGAVLALNTIVFKRRSVIRRFREGLAEGRRTFEEELETRLIEQVGLLFDELQDAFEPFFENIGHRGKDLERLQERLGHLEGALARENAAVRTLGG
jgi:GTP-binding protein EngB required for normal cell division